MSDCTCIVCRAKMLIERAAEIEADVDIDDADLFLLIQTTTLAAIGRGLPPPEFEKLLNAAWEQSMVLLSEPPDKRKMN